MEQKFLDRLLNLFVENGVKGLTMDEVAHAFGVSKKTLYQQYRNKEEVINAVLNYKLKQVYEHLQQHFASKIHPIDALICPVEEIGDMSEANRGLLTRQLVRYYPDIFQQHMMAFSEKISQAMKVNFEKGRALGLYRQDFNQSLYAELYFNLANSYDSAYFSTGVNPDRHTFQTLVTEFFLAAITTEAGKNYLKTHFPSSPQ